MRGLVPGIHVFLLLATFGSKTWMASEVGLARFPHLMCATSRANPTCGDKPGHDEYLAFARCRGMDGERVHAAGQLIRQCLVDHAMAFEAGLTFERLRHDIHFEVSLPARPVPGMAFVLVGFVLHLEALRCESLGQLLCDEIDGSHAVPLRRGRPAGQWPLRRRISTLSCCQVLNASPAKEHNDWS